MPQLTSVTLCLPRCNHSIRAGALFRHTAALSHNRWLGAGGILKLETRVVSLVALITIALLLAGCGSKLTCPTTSFNQGSGGGGGTVNSSSNPCGSGGSSSGGGGGGGGGGIGGSVVDFLYYID